LGQIVNLRRIVNPPAAFDARLAGKADAGYFSTQMSFSEVGMPAGNSGGRIVNPPQINNLPHERTPRMRERPA
jgi:hypothetical protein